MPTKKDSSKKTAAKKASTKTPVSKKAATKKAAGKKAKPEKIAYSISGEHLASSKVKSSYIAGNTFGLKAIKYAAVEGQAIFEGDIVHGSVTEMEAVKKSVENPQAGVEAAAIVVGNQFRWPDGVIVFR